MAATMGALDSRGVGQAAVLASAGGRLPLPRRAYRRGGRYRRGRCEETLRCRGVRRAVAALGAHRMQGRACRPHAKHPRPSPHLQPPTPRALPLPPQRTGDDSGAFG